MGGAAQKVRSRGGGSALERLLVRDGHFTVIAPHYEDAFTKIVETAPVAWLGDFIDMTHDLRCRAQEPRPLRCEEFGVMIEPTWKRLVIVGIRFQLDSGAQGGHELAS